MAGTPGAAEEEGIVLRRWILGLLLALSTLAAFWSVTSHDFIALDDGLYVSDNPHVRGGLTLEGVIWAFSGFRVANWHPLTWVSHMLDCELYGLNPAGHHVTSLVLHVLNTVLLFLVLGKMTGTLWRSSFVAALFALHPLHVESVAWVAERKDVLSTFFWLLTMWTYTHYVARPTLLRYCPVIVVFALGLMAKPMLVTLPFVLLLLDYWPLRRSTGTLGPFPEKLPLFALSAVSSLLTLLAQSGKAMPTLDALPLGARVTNALVSYVGYATRAFWPRDLAVLYPHPGVMELHSAALAALLLGALTTAAILWARRRPYLLVGWLWYLGTLVPVIGLVQVGEQAMADRYTYVPLIGLFIVVTWGTAEGLERWRAPKILGAAMAGLVLAVLSSTTVAQVARWKDSTRLFEHTLRVTEENVLVHNLLGVALEEQGLSEEAFHQYSEALRLSPTFAAAHTNLGAVLVEMGRIDEAIERHRVALRYEPSLARAHFNLGIALERQGRPKQAIQAYSDAVLAEPDDAPAHYNLGTLLAIEGELEAAERHLSRAVEIDPFHAPARHNLGLTLLKQHNPDRLPEAMREFAEARRLDPETGGASWVGHSTIRSPKR